MSKDLETYIKEGLATGKFPILYKKRSKGNKYQYWMVEVKVDDDGVAKIYQKSGIEGSEKPKDNVTPVKSGKNKGKKNETTPFQQALKDAASKFRLKFKSMRPRDTTGNIEMVASTAVLDPDELIWPMLLNDLNKIKNKDTKVTFPTYAERKYNGERVVIKRNKKGIIITMSRGGNLVNVYEYVTQDLKDLYADLEKLFGKEADKILSNLYLDGEIYIHGYSLQEIHSLVSTKKTKTQENLSKQVDSSKLELNLFDLYRRDKPDMPFSERYELLKSFLENKDGSQKYKRLKLVTVETVKSFEEIRKVTEKYKAEGYEGSVIRNPKGVYVPASSKSGPRTDNVLKYKIGMYDDAIIIDIDKKEKSKDAKSGKTNFQLIIHAKLLKDPKVMFKITGNGTDEYKREIYKNKKDFIGSVIEFTYTDTTKAKKPRNPVPVLDIDSGGNSKYKLSSIKNGITPTVSTETTNETENENDEIPDEE